MSHLHLYDIRWCQLWTFQPQVSKRIWETHLKLFFFFIWERSKWIYWTKSNRNTSSKSLGSFSTQTSVSTDKTALLARAWANLLPSLRTWIKEQLTKDELEQRISSIIWPNRVRQAPGALMAWMTRWQSPSKHTWKSINSFTKITTLWAASASACSTDWGLYIFWLSAPMMLPELSQTTTPSPANSLLSKKAASKLTYPPSAGGDHLTWGARCTGFRGCWWISKNSTTSSFTLRPISCRGQVGWRSCSLFLRCQRHQAIVEKRATEKLAPSSKTE